MVRVSGASSWSLIGCQQAQSYEGPGEPALTAVRLCLQWLYNAGDHISNLFFLPSSSNIIVFYSLIHNQRINKYRSTELFTMLRISDGSLLDPKQDNYTTLS
jgi:hypothetical protein